MFRIATIAAAASLIAPGPALAHAFLKSATPPVGGTVHSAPASVVIEFTESVEPRFSRIEVRDPAGTQVQSGDAQVAGGTGRVLSVALKALQPGTYKVTWHATATDAHRTEGSYSFTVQP